MSTIDLQDQCRNPTTGAIETDQIPTITYFLSGESFGYVLEQWLRQNGFFSNSSPSYCPVRYSYEALRGASTVATQFDELITLDAEKGVF